MSLKEPFLTCDDFDVIGFGILRDVLKHGYPTTCQHAKFSVACNFKIQTPEKYQVKGEDHVTFTLPKGITIIKH